MPKQRETPPRNVGDVITDGYVPTPLPPQAPDGGLVLTPPRSLPQLPAMLCERGPCRCFHLATAAVDAQTPLDGTEGYEPTQKIMACYPNPGIELELTLDAPITACNRWDPLDPSEVAERDKRRRYWEEHAEALDAASPASVTDAWQSNLAVTEDAIAESEPDDPAE